MEKVGEMRHLNEILILNCTKTTANCFNLPYAIDKETF